jgi:FKBP-type peptidyl-prolyl cis-trans isomerase
MHRVLALGVLCAQALATAPAQDPVTTLTIKETTAGQGNTLVVGDIATLCWLAKKNDGSVYEDRTNERQPMQLRVGPQVPEWWEEGLQRMRPGGTYRVEVPIDRMWPASRLPEALHGCKHLVYEVRVLRAIRMPRFQKLDAAKAKDEAGFPTEVLTAGSGTKPAKDHWCTFHFIAFTASGDVVDSSHALDKPMRVRPDALEVPFLAAILPRMAPGARWLCTSPVTAGHPRWAGILGDKELTWQVELLAVTPPLPMPAFEPPAAETMKASASGVRVLIDGGVPEAAPPDGTKQVRVHFACWLQDGTLVEASYPTGQPSELELARLPQGMSEGFLRIPGGAAAWLRIPAAQGYGAKGHQARKVPPDAELIMRVELLGIGK